MQNAKLLSPFLVIVAQLLLGCAAMEATPDGGTRRDSAMNRSETTEGGDAEVPPTDIMSIPLQDASNDVDWYAMRHDGMAEPPQMFCLPDGGRITADASADPFCPPDRNLQGCPCPTPGMTAPCWSGPRSGRMRGSCRDGMTRCTGEELPVWGPCEGEVLPDPMATRGAATCNCFSMGTWTIANISPCFIFTDMTYTRVSGATSSVLSGTNVTCGMPQGTTLNPPAPTWSTNSLRVDCGGSFRLCYRLRAFASLANAMSRTATDTDCVMAEPCVDAYVPPASSGMQITLPPIPGWATRTPTQTSCAQTFVNNGGYAEMVVSGQSYECQDIAQGMAGGYVFNRLLYCPSACQNPNIPASMRPAICSMCMNGSSGNF